MYLNSKRNESFWERLIFLSSVVYVEWNILVYKQVNLGCCMLFYSMVSCSMRHEFCCGWKISLRKEWEQVHFAKPFYEKETLMLYSFILLWQHHLAVISRNSLADKVGNHTQSYVFLFPWNHKKGPSLIGCKLLQDCTNVFQSIQNSWIPSE